jgi:hypothetical protein
MRHARLRLVAAEDSGTVALGSTELCVVPPIAESSVERLYVVDADEGPLPDDAA